MRILLISEYFPTSESGDFTGGVEARTFFIARELAKRHKVTVLCSYTYGSLRSQVLAGIHIIRVGPKRKYTSTVDFTRAFYITAAIWKGRNIPSDVVEGTNFINQVIAYAIGKAQNIPIVAWTPDVWRGRWLQNMGPVGFFTGEIVERFNLSHRDVYFMAISKTVLHKMKRAGVPEQLINVVPCGVDYSWIKKIHSPKEKQPTILVISRLVRYKSVNLTIRALAEVLQEIPEVQLKIIGQGEHQTYLQRLAKMLGINRQVQFIGFQPQYEKVISLLKSSHIFVFSSVTEGFGIVLLEAMAAGIPFVASDMPVHREVTGEKGGLFFKSGDVPDLAKKIKFLLKRKDIYQKMKQEGSSWASKYDWSIIARKTEEVYIRALRRYLQGRPLKMAY